MVKIFSYYFLFLFCSITSTAAYDIGTIVGKKKYFLQKTQILRFIEMLKFC